MKPEDIKEPIELTPQLLKTFKSAKIIKEHQKDVVGLDFSDDGEFLYTADSTTLIACNTQDGTIFRKLFMKNHEIELISHTHNNKAVLVASKKGHSIFYWSIHDNRVMKIFEGHKDTITNLILSPRDDSFITTSQDNTMRIWNLNSNSKECTFLLNVEEQNIGAYPIASYDPTGVVFAVAWSEMSSEKPFSRICLFGTEKCESGPFGDWKLDKYSEIKIMKFSKCGDLLLIATTDNMIVLLDAFDGKEKYKFTSFLNESSIIECSFTPDTKYIVSGSEDGVVHIWSILGEEIAQLKSHIEKVFFVKFSPIHCMLVTGGRNVTWWLPDQQALDSLEKLSI